MKKHTINDFFELKTYLDSLDPHGVWLFRGQADASWDLIPSMFRGIDALNPPYKEADGEWIAQMERNIYRAFGQHSIRHHNTSDMWEQLCLAQHYGVPTRLLDWTTRPYVAAYFAVANNQNAPASIWALNIDKYPFPSFLGRVAKGYAHRLDVIRSISRQRGPSFFQTVTEPYSMLTSKKRGKSSPDDELADRCEGFLVVLDPPKFDDRIAAQHGLFTLHYSFDDYDLIWNHTDHLKRVERQEGIDILHHIRIPKHRRKDLRQALEKGPGMSYYDLYPDLVGLGYHLTAERQVDFDSYIGDRS